MLIPLGFYFLHFFKYTFISFSALFPFPMAMVCGLFVRRLNEECVQKPVTERTHSEGTSQHKGHHKRQIAAGVSLSLFSFLSIKHCSCFGVFFPKLQQKQFVSAVVVCMTYFPFKNNLSLWGLLLKHYCLSAGTQFSVDAEKVPEEPQHFHNSSRS